jgi:hypothetical protein
LTSAAKTPQQRPKDLIAYLVSHHWIHRRPSTALYGDGNECVAEQVRATPLSLAKPTKLFCAYLTISP